MKSFVKRNEDKGIKRKKLFLDRKKAIIRNELYVKIIRTTSKQDTTKGDKDYMCGFAGFVGEVENREEVLENMMNTIIHRGPDSEGKYVDEDAALGFRRLSIIDLSEVGDQPLYNEDRSKVLVFNGEIYNYQELRKELVEAGHVFVSNTDSETLIHGYEEWGESLVERLRGMYAFVIWDTKTKKLFGARDIFGIKPMYYAQMNGTLMFGSEIKSFMEHPKFDKIFNEDATLKIIL